MAERGVNGASAATLNQRFIKCAGCNVNIPKEDMLSRGKCTVCGRAYEPPQTSEAAPCVAFAAKEAPAALDKPKDKPKRKRWVVMVSKRGREYYHNTETGEDRWDKPADIDAEASDNQFVPFKNDSVKKALLREQAKTEAQKYGVPVDLIAKAQAQDDDDDDPFAKMTQQAKAAASAEQRQKQTLQPHPSTTPPAAPSKADHHHAGSETDDAAGVSCSIM